MLRHGASLGLLFIYGFLTFSCRTTNPRASSRLTSENVPSQAKATPESFIKKLYKKYNPYLLQDEADVPDDCASFYMKADPTVPYLGVAVLYHGFTGCPQQFYEVAQILSKRGYASFVPLMPGQGKGPPPFAEDDHRSVNNVPYKDYYSSHIPHMQNEDWKRYLGFVGEVNAFVATLPGEKILAGLSVGGALATAAYLDMPDLYKRALLIAPYYGMPGAYSGRKSQSTGPWQAIKRLTGDTLNQIEKNILDLGSQTLEAVAGQEISWGEDCYKQTRGYNGNPGRRGICDFRYENLAALNALGEHLLERLQKDEALAQIPKLQFMVIEWDNGANTVATRKAIAFQKKRFGVGKVSACFYPNSVPHSMFSRKDLAKFDEAPWLNSFLYEATGFLSASVNVKESGEVSEETVYDAEADLDTRDRQKRCSIYPVDYAEIIQTKP